MAFNAGSIEATLTLNRNPFTAGLAAARSQARGFARERYEATAAIRIDKNAFDNVIRQLRNFTKNSRQALAQVNVRREAFDKLVRDLREFGRSVYTATVDVNVRDSGARLAALIEALNRAGRSADDNSIRFRNFGNESSGAFRRADGAARIFIGGMPLLLPLLGALVQGALGLGGALTAVFVGGIATLGAFGAVAVPTFKKIQEAAGKSREEIAKMPDGIRQAAGALKTLQDEYQKLVQRTERNVGLALAEGFNAASAAVRTLDPLINSMAGVIAHVGREATTYFSSSHWRDFVNFMAKEMVPVWMSFWDIVKYLTRAVMDLSVAFMPMAQWLMAAIADGMRQFSEWASKLAGDPAFIQWVENAKESLRAFWDFLVSVTQFLFRLASALAPIGVVVMDMLTGIFNSLSKMPPEWLAGIAGGLSAIMAALLFGASGPVALVAGVITGIAFALAYLYDSNEKVRQSIDAFINDIQSRFQPTFEAVRDAIENKIIPAWDKLVAAWEEHVLPALQELWTQFKEKIFPVIDEIARTVTEKLIPAWLELQTALAPIIGWLIKTLGTDLIDSLEILGRAFDGGLQMIAGLFKTVTGIITGDWELMGEGLKGIAEGFWTVIAGIFGMNLDELKAKFTEWDKWLQDTWNQFWTDIGQGWTDFWTGVGQKFEEGKTGISEGWNTFWTDVGTKFDEFKTTVLESWHGFWAGLLDGLGLNGDQIVHGWQEKWNQMWIDASAKWEEIKAGWNAFWGIIGSVLETEKQKAIDAWNTFWDGVNQKATEIWDAIKQGWNDFWASGIGQKLTEEVEKFKTQWNTFWDGVQTKASEIWEGIKSGWADFWGQFQSTQDGGQTTSSQSWGEWFRGLGESLGSFIRTELDNWNRFWGDLNANAQRWWGDIQAGWDRMLEGIRSAAGRIWGSIESAFNTGVNTVKGAVNGLINPINNVLKTLGIPTIPTLEAGGALRNVGEFAAGGTVKWEHVGAGFKTDGPRAIVGEGNSKYPEYVIPTDPKYRGRAKNLFTSAGRDLQLMADGGIIGGITGALGLPSLDSMLGGMTGMTYPWLDMAKSVGKKIYDGALKKIQDAFASMIGGGTGGGGVGWMMSVLRAVFPGLPLISGLRPGAITATGNRSYHSMGRAVDVPPRMDVFNWIRATFGANTKELIFTPAGGRQIHNGRPHVYTGITAAQHYDHVHWAFDQGGMLPPGAGNYVNRTGKPEAVLTNDQWQSVMQHTPVAYENNGMADDNSRVVSTLQDIRELLERRGTGATVNMHGVGGSANENAQAVRLALRLS